MKKKIILAVVTLSLAGIMLTGCGKDIGQKAAKEAALQDAGVAEADTSRFKISKERDDGKDIYEVEFTVGGNQEYSYEIDASDGSILSSEVDSQNNGAAGNAGSSQSAGNDQGTDNNQNTENNTTSDNSQTVQNNQATDNNQAVQDNQNTGTSSTRQGVAISEADAKKAALDRVPGATEADLMMELDFDDGQYIYEGDIIYQQKEYEFEIDANTGNFLKWSEERH